MNNKQILDNAPEGATHVSDNGVYYFMNYPVAMNYWTRGQEWVESGGIHHLCRSLSEISEIESLREQLKTARADVLTSFVSDTTETGQFGWSDCQWLDDWKHEWLEQQAKG